MIYVNLKGGLGNQMFQYATARSLAERHHVEVGLDLRELQDRTEKENFTFRDYELNKFNVTGKVVKNDFFSKRLNKSPQTDTLRIPKGFKKLIRSLLDIPELYREQGYFFNPHFNELGNNSYLDGYWQSEEYFKNIRSILLKDFSFKNLPDPVNAEYVEEIKRSNAVAIHVRRGDFVQNAHNLSFHGVCDINYYYSAIDKIRSLVPDPVFYFFSDDMEWVKENIRPEGIPVKYLSHNNAANAEEDMRLMSLCKHNIIANSSFSWWSAWLNDHPGKIVIAPRYWFKDSSVNTTDLIPASWYKMS